MSKHSIIPPSSAARRMACPGSRKLEASVPYQATDAAAEGTLAHALAAQAIDAKNRVEKMDYPDTEMSRHVQGYVDFLGDIRVKTNANVSEFEITREFPLVHAISFGTPDAVLRGNDQVHVIDLKYGFAPVQAYENWQLLTYASAFFNPTATYHLHIYQPRDYISSSPIKTWTLTAPELLKYIARLQQSEELALTDDAPLRAGTHCGHCSAKHLCPALQIAAAKVVEISSEPTALEQLPSHAAGELAILQDAAKVIDARINALETVVFEALKNGASISQFILSSYGRKSWNISAREVITLGGLYGCDLHKETKMEVLTPTQAIKAGVPAEVIREFTNTPTKVKLERNSY